MERMLINWKKVSAIDNNNGKEILTYPKILVNIYPKKVCPCKNRQGSCETKSEKSIQLTNPSTYILLPFKRSLVMAMWPYSQIAK
jgi:hypothetical protein